MYTYTLLEHVVLRSDGLSIPIDNNHHLYRTFLEECQQQNALDNHGNPIVDNVFTFPNPKLVQQQSLQWAQQQGKYIIDQVAGEARGRYITVAPGQEMTYLEKFDQASKYIAAGYPTDLIPYPFIIAEVNATSQTPQMVADQIVAQRNAWLVVGATIEEFRRLGKIQIDNALNAEEVNNVVAATVAILNRL